MRNNQERFNAPESNEDNTGATPPTPPPQNTGGLTQQPQSALQYVTPTEYVEIPSEGKFYPQSHPLHGKKLVEIYHLLRLNNLL